MNKLIKSHGIEMGEEFKARHNFNEDDPNEAKLKKQIEDLQKTDVEYRKELDDLYIDKVNFEGKEEKIEEKEEKEWKPNETLATFTFGNHVTSKEN